MNEDEELLASDSYGYGRWEAPYWFIGIEEGHAPWENGDYSQRASAFRDLATNGLSDCRRFHLTIGEERFHKPNSANGNVMLQGTWKYLITLMMAFQGRSLDKIRRKNVIWQYQSTLWGSDDPASAETCVIELCGLPARDTRVSRNRSKEIRERLDHIRTARIRRIREVIRSNLGSLRFVVMYGKGEKKSWEAIADSELEFGVPRRVGSAVFLYDRHPLYTSYEYWEERGWAIQREAKRG